MTPSRTRRPTAWTRVIWHSAPEPALGTVTAEPSLVVRTDNYHQATNQGPDSPLTPLTEANPIPPPGTALVTPVSGPPSKAHMAGSSDPHSELRSPPRPPEAGSWGSPESASFSSKVVQRPPRVTEPLPTILPTFLVALGQWGSNCGRQPLAQGQQTPVKSQMVDISTSLSHQVSVAMTQLPQTRHE